jgi:hypothetical protein
MYKYGVDLAIFGHVHNSQRFTPMNNSVVDSAGMNDPKAPMYIVAGGAGNIEGLSSLGANVTGNMWGYDSDFSYSTVTFTDSNHLTVKFLNSNTGAVLDSSTLYKSHKQNFVVQ